MAGEFDDILGITRETSPSPAATGAQPEGGMFDDILGIKRKPERTLSGTARDVLATTAKGITGAADAITGLANMPTLGYAGRAKDLVGLQQVYDDPREADSALDDHQRNIAAGKRNQFIDQSPYSEAQQYAQRQVSEADGFVGKLSAAVGNPSTIATAVGESLPTMVMGGAAGMGFRALAPKIAPVVAGATGEGLMAAGSASEQIRQESPTGTLTPKQTAIAAASGIGTGVFGVIGGKIANKLGFADADTMLATGMLSDSVRKGGLKEVGKRIVGGGISEGVFEELPQSVQEQIWQNAATDKPIMEGVDESAAMGLLSGLAMGSGANILPVRSQSSNSSNLTGNTLPEETGAAPAAQAEPVAPPAPTGPLSRAVGVSAMSAVPEQGYGYGALQDTLDRRQMDREWQEQEQAALGYNQARNELGASMATRKALMGTAPADTFDRAATERLVNVESLDRNTMGRVTPETSVLAAQAGLTPGQRRAETQADYQELFGGKSVLSDAAEQRLSLLERQMAGGEVGQRFQKDDGTWDGVKSTNPEWLKSGPLKEAGKAGVRRVIELARTGGAMTNNQQFLWSEVKKAADKEYENDPATMQAREAERIQGELGIELHSPEAMPVGNLDVGDKAVVVGKNGVPDVVEHKGYGEDGKAILKDGVTVAADPWDMVETMGVKPDTGRFEKRMRDYSKFGDTSRYSEVTNGQRELSSNQGQPAPVAETVPRTVGATSPAATIPQDSVAFLREQLIRKRAAGSSNESVTPSTDTQGFVRDQQIRRVASGQIAEPVRRLPGETAREFLNRRKAQQKADQPSVETVTAPSQGEASKQPWEMTRAELAAQGKARAAGDLKSLSQKRETLIASVPKSVTAGNLTRKGKFSGESSSAGEWRKENLRSIEVLDAQIRTKKEILDAYEDNDGIARLREFHRRSIEKALAEGKPVPAEVLADYPNLQPIGQSPSVADRMADRMADSSSSGKENKEPVPTQKAENKPGVKDSLTVQPGEQADAPHVNIASKVKNHISTGQKISTPMLFNWTGEAYGGKQSEGRYTPKDAYDALELGINQYLANGFKFVSEDPQQRIKELEQLLALVPTQTKRTKEQDQFQQYSTPPTLAFVADWVANVGRDDTVLEPSAGIGGIAVFAKIDGAKQVVVNELSERRRSILQAMGFDRVFGENAEQINNVLPADVRPTVVLMNPPFSATAGRVSGNKTKYGAQHIEQALKRLEPGGRLVAIVGEGMAADRQSFREWWQKIAKEYTVRANVGMNGEGYRKYGTTFDNQILVIDKTGPTTDTIITGKAEHYADLIPLLQGVRNERTAIAQQPANQQAGKEKTDRGETGAKREQAVSSATPPVGAGQREPASGTGSRGQDRADVAVETPPVDGANNQSGARGGGAGADGKRKPDAGTTGMVDSGRDREPAQGADALNVSRKEKDTAQSDDSVVESYQPTVIIAGAKPHPADLIESAAMAAVSLPNISYKPHIPQKTVADGLLSEVQLEAIAAAGQAHQDVLPNGERRGFFIGDGTGVGKGREISGILWDNWNQGRRRSIWVSKDRTLAKDAKRDMLGVGWNDKLMIEQGQSKAGEGLPNRDGVLYTAYSTVASKAKPGQKSRLDAIVEWAGPDFDGVIAFDESHKMGNAIAIKDGRYTKQPSQMALAALDLQKKLPKARVVYVSATGATEISNLAYANRLGLWGEGTAFPSVTSFIGRVSQGGIAAMEVVARDMKAMGSYLARKLAFNGKSKAYQVKYKRLEHSLTQDQSQIYDELARAWQGVLSNIHEALALTEANGEGKGHAMSAFWGAHQRFFNQVLTAMQMPSVVQSIRKDIEAGKAVVLQITNTNEASTTRALANAESLEDLDITPRDALMQMVQNSFPIQQYEEYEDEDGNKRTRPVVDSEGNPVVNREAVQMRERLLDKLGSIRVPDAPLEQVLNTFGVENVAEVTGRSKRVVTVDTEDGRKKVRQSWSKLKGVADAALFMDDKKSILIFSEAGGTGASYHADVKAKNQRQRAHYILQAGWRADSAIQGLGRSHRSNQAVAPEYVLVTTNLKGHMRFISSIARRLSQLGALTEGERTASSQGLFSERDNLESQYATDAVTRLVDDVHRGKVPGLTMMEFSQELGLPDLVDEHGNLNASKVPTVTKFLNRILSMTIDTQNRVFDLFAERLDDNIDRAERNGTLDQGLETIKALSIKEVDRKTVYTDEKSGAETQYVQLDVERPTYKADLKRGASIRVNKKSGAPWQIIGYKSVTEDSGNVIDVATMLSPRGTKRDVNVKSLDDKFTILSGKDARDAWEAAKREIPDTTTSREHLITGALLPIWDKLKGHPRIVRVNAGDKTMLGRLIPGEHLSEVMALLDVEGKALDIAPEMVVDSVLHGGQKVIFDNGWRLERRRVADENRIEIIGPTWTDFDRLTGKGAFTERINYQTRIFIPTGKDSAQVIAEIQNAMRLKVMNIIKGSEPLYSQTAQSVPATQRADIEGELTTAFGKLRTRLLLRKVGIVDTQAEAKRIVEGVGAQLSVQYSKSGAIKGFYLNGKAYLVRDGIEQGNTMGVLLHELGEHAKHLGFAKDIEYRAILNSLKSRQDAQNETGKAIRAAMAKVPTDTKPEHYWSEVAAYLVEMNAGKQIGIVDRILNFFKKWLFKAGGINADKFSVSDIVLFARAAVNAETGLSLKEAAREFAGSLNLAPSLSPAVQYSLAEIVAHAKAFYSKLQQVAGDKFQGMKAQSVEPFLVKHGVKKAEIEATGLREWLAGMKPTDKVTKEGLLDFVKANTVEFEDVVLGEKPNDQKLIDEAEEKGDWVERDRLTRLYSEPEQSRPTHFDQYTEPGAKEGSYREMFVTAPNQELSLETMLSPDATKRAFGKRAYWQDGHSQYEQIQNPVVRIRFNEVVKDGPDSERLLNEWLDIQDDETLSDYLPWKQRYEASQQRILRIEEIQGPSPENQAKMPKHLKDSIYTIGVKRILAYAKENGFDGVALATKPGRTAGETQGLRYGLSERMNGFEGVDAFDAATKDVGYFLGRYLQSVKFFDSLSLPGFYRNRLDSSGGKSLANTASVNAKEIGNILESESFVSHGYSSLDVPSKRLVASGMLAMLHDNKIFDSVVRLIPVDMVNNLNIGELSSKIGLNDPSMFENISPIKVLDDIALLVDMPINDLVSVITFLSTVNDARIRDLNSGWISLKSLSATRAKQGGLLSHGRDVTGKTTELLPGPFVLSSTSRALSESIHNNSSLNDSNRVINYIPENRGSQGLKQLYDTDLPNIFKAWGGEKMGAIGFDPQAVATKDRYTGKYFYGENSPQFDTREEADAWLQDQSTMPYIPITAKTADSYPMFSRSSQTDTAAFNKWFGDSMVVGRDGKPFVMYHGTAHPQFLRDNEYPWVFDRNRPKNPANSNLSGLGIFLGNKRAGEIHAGFEGTVHPFYVRMENPYVTTAAALEKKVESSGADVVRKRLQELNGHDGIIIKDRGHIVVFDGNQVKSAEDNTGAFSRSDNDVRYSIRTMEREFDDTEASIASSLREKQVFRNDAGALERLWKTFDYMSRLSEATKKIFKYGSEDRRENKVHFENFLLDGITRGPNGEIDPMFEAKKASGFVPYMQELEKKDNKTFDKVNRYLLGVDETGQAFTLERIDGITVSTPEGKVLARGLKSSEEAYAIARNHHAATGKKGLIADYKREEDREDWVVRSPRKITVKDGEPVKSGGDIISIHATEGEAVIARREAEAKQMAKDGYGDKEIEAAMKVREVTDRGFDLQVADLRRVIDEAKELGLDEPTVDVPDESKRYVILDAKGEKVKGAFYSTREEAESFALAVSKNMRFQVKKQKDSEIMMPITLSNAIARMGDLRGSYFPRQRTPGAVVMAAVNKKTGQKIMKKFDLYAMGKNRLDLDTGDMVTESSIKSFLRERANRITPLGREKARLEKQGFTVEVSPDKQMPDMLFEVTKLSSAISVMVEQGAQGIKKKNDPKLQAAYNELTKMLAMNIADIYKKRGYLSSRLQRSEDYWEGFETNMLKAVTQYSKGLAAGVAKRQAAQKMTMAMTGRDVSWKQFQNENPGAKWEDYQAHVDENRIDPVSQPNLYKETTSWMQEMLRNDEQADRIMGTVKGLAVLSFMGFRVSSAAVNMVNMVQAVPATIAAQSGASIRRALWQVGASGSAYTKFLKGKSEGVDHKVFEEIVERGWDAPQFNHDAAAVLRSKSGNALATFTDWSMAMFGFVEKVNRATTIHAAYMQLKNKMPGLSHAESMERAKQISDDAHGVYGKETAPAWTRGAVNPLKLSYTFQRFMHNYALNMGQMWEKGKYKEFAYMLLSPGILAGPAASIAVAAVFQALGYAGLGGDDPEEGFYEWAEKLFGTGSTGARMARHGLAGAMGLNMKGSIEMGFAFPTTIPELLGAPGSLFMDTATGLKHLGKGEWSKAVEKALPVAGVKNAFKAIREHAEGATTGGYSPIFYGNAPVKASGGDTVLRFFGFNPSETSAQRERQWSEKRVSKKYQEERKGIYDQVRRMIVQGDGTIDRGAWAEIMGDVYRYNQKVVTGDHRAEAKITHSSILAAMRSAKVAPKRERMRAQVSS